MSLDPACRLVAVQKRQLYIHQDEIGPIRGGGRNAVLAIFGFDQLVADGRMPNPVRIDGCVIWDLSRLDVAFDSLSRQDDGANPWD